MLNFDLSKDTCEYPRSWRAASSSPTKSWRWWCRLIKCVVNLANEKTLFKKCRSLTKKGVIRVHVGTSLQVNLPHVDLIKTQCKTFNNALDHVLGPGLMSRPRVSLERSALLGPLGLRQSTVCRAIAYNKWRCLAYVLQILIPVESKAIDFNFSCFKNHGHQER